MPSLAQGLRTAAGLFSLVLMLTVTATRGAERFTFYHENVMGTSLELQVLADQESEARWAEATVLGEIDRLSTIFSSYDPRSELAQWLSTRGEPTELSPELYALLVESDRWNALSQGAFDVRVQALTEVWKQAEQANERPSAASLQAALQQLTAPAWQLQKPGTKAIHTSGCAISLNAIAKGEIIERACRLASRPDRGIQGLLLNVGGDLRVAGELSTSIAVLDPLQDSESSEPLLLVQIQNRALSTSGASQRGFRIQGQTYSHILDPRSGQPVETVASATVIAPHAASSDALATICNVLSPEQSMKLIDALPGTACLLITRTGEQIRSSRWLEFEVPTRPLQALASSLPNAAESAPTVPSEPGNADQAELWNTNFEFELRFEILKPEGAEPRYRRPYVVAWLEDSEGKTVRTLILWVSLGGQGPDRWLPDLKRWYRGDLDEVSEKKNLIYTVGRPTRPPGQYSAIWDGKNDTGKLVPQGKYTLLIDSAREHGAYQHIRKPIEIGDKPFSEPLTGNSEIGSVKIEYREKPKKE